MSSNLPDDPIAQKLRDAVAQSEAQKVATTGERLLSSDFARLAKQRGPAELEQIEKVFSDRIRSINAHKPSQLPEILYVRIAHRVEAGKYAAVVDPLDLLSHFELRVTVGLHPSAHQFMDEVPDVQSTRWSLRAAVDERGVFSWAQADTDARWTSEQVVDAALTALSDLLVADLESPA